MNVKNSFIHTRTSKYLAKIRDESITILRIYELNTGMESDEYFNYCFNIEIM